MEAATRAAAKVTAVAVRCGSVRGATEVAVVSGAWAECSGRGGAGGTAAAVAATGAAGKITAVAVCCGSVRGATEVAVVSGAWAECSGRGGAGGTAAAVAATGAAVKVTAGAVCGGIVWVGAGLAACHSDARFGCRARKI